MCGKKDVRFYNYLQSGKGTTLKYILVRKACFLTDNH